MEPFYLYRLLSWGQFSLPSSWCGACTCCACASSRSESLGMTAFCRWTVTLSTGARWGHFLWCEWVQKALNTTELPQAHIDFLAERRLLGGGAGKDNRKAGGFLESPSCPLQHKSIVGERTTKTLPRHRREQGYATEPHQLKDDFLALFEYKTNVLFVSELLRSAVCVRLWQTTKDRKLCRLLCNPPGANSLYTFTWLFHSLRLSGCVPKHTIIVFCCVFRSKKLHIHVEDCWGARKVNCSCGILYPPNQRNHISLIRPQELCLCESYFTSLLKGTSLTKPKLILFVETSVQQSGLEDFFLGLIELQFLDNFRKANELRVPSPNVQSCWRPCVGFHLITHHFNQCHVRQKKTKQKTLKKLKWMMIS